MFKNYNFEKLLGRSISEINQFLNCDFQQSILNKSFHDITLNKDSNYYGSHFKFMSFVIDENNKINSITVHFITIINLNFYNLFVNNYGKPSNIIVKTGKKTINTSEYDDESKSFKQKLTQTFFETKEGQFEDKPSSVLWKKENYTFKIVMYYEENVSSIAFTKLV